MEFPEIDKEQTIKNVDKFLKKYHTIRRLSGNDIPQRLTSIITDTPSTGTHNNHALEDKIANKIDCEQIFLDINLAISKLDKDSQNLIWGKYIASDRYTDYDYYSKMCISKSTYYEWLNRARIEFAEAYHGGELFVMC